jgi:hypothetical protein
VTIGEVLEAAAAGLDGVERRSAGDGIEWATGGIAFAAVAGSAAEFRLSQAIAAAARATPDAGPSARGADWVAFSPSELDRYSLDRAVAWFGSAYRNAARAPGPGNRNGPGQ